MRTIRTLMMLAVAMVATAASANHYSDFYVIPVGSHTPGQNGTMWMSDIAIQNFQTSPITVQLVFIESGEQNADNVQPIVTQAVNGSVTVPANGNVLLKDVLNGYRGMQSARGAILVGSDRPFAVTSRSYSMSPAGDTIGQTVTPVRDFIDNTVGRTDNALATAYIPGLINNANFRTNLGMVVGNASGSGQTMGVTLTIRNAAGQAVGNRLISIPPGSFTHVQFPLSSVTEQSFDIGGADLRITQGSGAVVPYASVIDNRTADAVFVVGTFPPNAPMSKGVLSQGPFRELFDLFKLP